jgi:DNA-binding NarL/FixJ family response regulator
MAKKIIIADDNPVFRGALKSLISGRDFEIAAEAGDGIEAMEKVEEECPDILLLDIDMPGMDGMEVLKSLKKIRPELKIVMVTTYSHYLEQALEAGADGYCVKGCNPMELRKGVGRVLNGENLILTD